jgi:ElaB/YqjD/DUF883 family membrane-anchored ribosome-binding protein
MQTTNDFADKGQVMADKAADRIQGGIRDAKNTVSSTASNLSDRVESFRSAVGGATQRVQDTLADTQDSIVTYTKENPVKALMVAAAAGAVLVGLIRALTPSRD